MKKKKKKDNLTAGGDDDALPDDPALSLRPSAMATEAAESAPDCTPSRQALQRRVVSTLPPMRTLATARLMRQIWRGARHIVSDAGAERGREGGGAT